MDKHSIPAAMPQAALREPTLVEAARTKRERDSLSIARVSNATSMNTAGSGWAFGGFEMAVPRILVKNVEC
jgi:hypothetical protein